MLSLYNMPQESTFEGIALSPQNQTYLIDDGYGVYQWMPEQAEPWQYLCTLDTSSSSDYPGHVTYTADGDTLYGCFTEYEDGHPFRGTVFAFSLESGACEKLFTDPYMTAAYYPVETDEAPKRTMVGSLNEYEIVGVPVGIREKG